MSEHTTPNFFAPGCTYRWGPVQFRCHAVTTHPGTGDRVALGWYRGTGGTWCAVSEDEAEWAAGRWVDEADAVPASRCVLHGSSCDGDMEQAHIVQPAAVAEQRRVCAFKNPHEPHLNEPGSPDEWQCPGVPKAGPAARCNIAESAYGRQCVKDAGHDRHCDPHEYDPNAGKPTAPLLDPRSFDRPGQRAAARMLNADRKRPVTLATDCANCGHALNWHDGACVAGRDEECGCTDFTLAGKDTSAGGESTRTADVPEADEDEEFPSGGSLIRHPSHASTRRYLAANPLPQQQKRTT